MVASLKAHGQIVPLLVKELEGKPGYYDVIAGSRRLAAAREAKLPDLESDGKNWKLEGEFQARRR